MTRKLKTVQKQSVVNDGFSNKIHLFSQGPNKAKEALEHIGTALDFYDQIISQTGSFKQFEKDIEPPQPNHLSVESGDLIGSIKTLLLGATDALDRSKEAVYEYCGLANGLLSNYIKLINKNGPSNAIKTIFDRVVKSAAEKLNESIDELAACSSIYYYATTNLTTLNNKLARETTSEIESIKQLYSDMKAKVSDANRIIGETETKQKLRNEIQIIQQSNIPSIDYATVDNSIRQSIIESAENLQNKLNELKNKYSI